MVDIAFKMDRQMDEKFDPIQKQETIKGKT